MKIFVDENIPKMTVKELSIKGFDVLDIKNTLKEGIPDSEIWKIVKNEKRILITTDKGFSKNRYDEHFGILIVRLKKPNRFKIHEKIMNAIDKIGKNEWKNLLIVIKDNTQSFWRKK